MQISQNTKETLMALAKYLPTFEATMKHAVKRRSNIDKLLILFLMAKLQCVWDRGTYAKPFLNYKTSNSSINTDNKSIWKNPIK